MTWWSRLRPRRSEVMEVTMIRLFGWMVAGGVLLGSASVAEAQASRSVGTLATATGITSGIPLAGNGYPVGAAYGDLSAQALGNPAYPGVPLAGLPYGPAGGYSVPVI